MLLQNEQNKKKLTYDTRKKKNINRRERSNLEAKSFEQVFAYFLKRDINEL